LGYEEGRCWANCSRSQFPRFSTHVVTIHHRHRQTDRQTDRQTTCDSKTALCTIVHHVVKGEKNGTEERVGKGRVKGGRGMGGRLRESMDRGGKEEKEEKGKGKW